MGNRTAVRKVDSCGRILEQETFTYNDSNQLIKSTYQSGRKISTLYYGYDRDGNRIYEVGKKGNECVETYYKYDVENRLAAVYDGRELLMAAAYDGDGNRVFQLNYNPTEEKDWKDYRDKDDYPDYSDSHHKNDNGKQDASHDSGNKADGGKGNAGNHMDHKVFVGAMAGICNLPGLIRREVNTVSWESNKTGDGRSNNSKDNADDQADNKNKGASDHKQQESGQNHEIDDSYDVIFPIGRDEDRTDYRNYKNGHGIVYDIKTAGRGSDYELIEYINDVNREYTEVLAEQSVHGRTDTSYIYGVDRLSLDGYNGCSGYYLYDPRGSVTGITGEWGQLYQSYRYSVTGEITFGAPQYENEYTYNGESYNPNIESQYLRARYYDVVNANFLTEDSYLGDIAEPLTLNRYNYCVSSYPNYQDPSGKWVTKEEEKELLNRINKMSIHEQLHRYGIAGLSLEMRVMSLLSALHELQMPQANVEYVLNFNYRNQTYCQRIINRAEDKRTDVRCTNLVKSNAIYVLDEYLKGNISEYYARRYVSDLAEIGALYDGKYVTSVKEYRSDNGNRDYQRFDTQLIGWVAYYNIKNPQYSINPEWVKAMLYVETRYGYYRSSSPNANVSVDIMQTLDPRNTTIYDYVNVDIGNTYVAGPGYNDVNSPDYRVTVDEIRSINNLSPISQESTGGDIIPLVQTLFVRNNDEYFYEYSKATSFMSLSIGIYTLQKKYKKVGQQASMDSILSNYNVGDSKYVDKVKYLLDIDAQSGWENDYDKYFN